MEIWTAGPGNQGAGFCGTDHSLRETPLSVCPLEPWAVFLADDGGNYVASPVTAHHAIRPVRSSEHQGSVLDGKVGGRGSRRQEQRLGMGGGKSVQMGGLPSHTTWPRIRRQVHYRHHSGLIRGQIHDPSRELDSVPNSGSVPPGFGRGPQYRYRVAGATGAPSGRPRSRQPRRRPAPSPLSQFHRSTAWTSTHVVFELAGPYRHVHRISGRERPGDRPAHEPQPLGGPRPTPWAPRFPSRTAMPIRNASVPFPTSLLFKTAPLRIGTVGFCFC